MSRKMKVVAGRCEAFLNTSTPEEGVCVCVYVCVCVCGGDGGGGGGWVVDGEV